MGNDSDKLILPEHIAIIMDGNGRWAKKRFLTKNAGHRAGAQALNKLTEKMNAAGFKILTVYAFSTENWTRPPSEVEGIMQLLREYIQRYIDDSKKNNWRLDVIGDLSKLDTDLREKIEYLRELTRDHDGIRLNIALNYGGRDEIVRATKTIAEKAAKGELSSENIDENVFASFLDTAGQPDPDLLIRTSGELRLSNFMLWQMSYAEICCIDKLWPDFTIDDVMKAVQEFQRRDRRYGGRKK